MMGPTMRMWASLVTGALAPLTLWGCSAAEGEAPDQEEAAAPAASDPKLGSVDLPRPDWLPDDLPLPEDAHIYLSATHSNAQPAIHQLQARTMEDPASVAQAFIEWARGAGLEPVDESRASQPDIAVVSFRGESFNHSNLQVYRHDGGPNAIILSVVGQPWD